MPSALTPKVPLTVVANQGIVGMATTVQVGACEVLYIYLGSQSLQGHRYSPHWITGARNSSFPREK